MFREGEYLEVSGNRSISLSPCRVKYLCHLLMVLRNCVALLAVNVQRILLTKSHSKVNITVHSRVVVIVTSMSLVWFTNMLHLQQPVL